MSSTFTMSGKRVFVAGHRGLVGSAIMRRLASENVNVVTATRTELDLRDVGKTLEWFKANKPDVVYLAAAKVGGIQANSIYPADFLGENLAIQQAVIGAAAQTDVQKLVFLGSSCIYPKLAPQPISEDSLLTGPLEPTNEWYAIAKIAGLKYCAALRRQYGKDFVSAMPTNMYGPNDNYDLNNSHVLPALLRKIHTAKVKGESQVVVWGTGKPRREFMHADDCADALIHVAKYYSDEAPINIGTGQDVEISELAETLARVIGFRGKFTHDLSKPDGTPRKLQDVKKLHGLGWTHRISLEEGCTRTYQDFLKLNLA
jgi:GDP-L-fucose synthase